MQSTLWEDEELLLHAHTYTHTHTHTQTHKHTAYIHITEIKLPRHACLLYFEKSPHYVILDTEFTEFQP